MTQFLYGDSSPFPFDFNFLATIEVFMASATRVVLLESETKAQMQDSGSGEREREEKLTAMKGLHQRLMLALERATNDQSYNAARDYTDELQEAAKRIVDRHHRQAREATEGEQAQLAADRDRRAHEARGHLEQFFLKAKMPIADWQVTLELQAEGKEGVNVMSALLAHPQRITSTVQLDPRGEWAHPRKVSEFTSEMDLLVGVKKSFFGGKVTAESVRLDEWTISAFELREDLARISLRKKPIEKDALIFHLRRAENGMLSGHVDHPGDPNAAQLPSAVDTADLPKLDALWRKMRAAAQPLLDAKGRRLGLTLAAADVFASALALPLPVRLVDSFAPIVRAIAERSPNNHELSLKMENEGGRREEVYLRRDELLSKLQPLSGDGRAVFAPLGLDDWMPTLTLRPPPVAPPPREPIISMDVEPD
ncbi:MAG: hypothetical protein HOV80_37240 [Polyangiaceae bacterium]|nr:hypothetical protein [Polyangiaceae bacterium]